MSRQSDYWLHQQLNPNDRIIVGHKDKSKTTMQLKAEMVEQEMAEWGEEEYLKKMEAWREYEANRFKDNQE